MAGLRRPKSRPARDLLPAGGVLIVEFEKFVLIDAIGKVFQRAVLIPKITT